jgi:hypothetical protein
MPNATTKIKITVYNPSVGEINVSQQVIRGLLTIRKF